jgi:hypothetical protein
MPVKRVLKYGLGLLAEECGEVVEVCASIQLECGKVVQLCGKAFRFGLDTPSKSRGGTARELLHEECGDILAAIDYAVERGILDPDKLEKRRTHKRKRLLNPKSKDGLGRRLAP